ncbi:hypothetical protein [Marinobacterium arenosum]|uniref:hypothetical protein n=1 Tax=Marinobacterium arenosum TaxID=2862496 RepID=UPI001C94A9E9|nr:hypothetical protein [Marinobacterium arenosum]MBY4678164.1 hypothetical protein [Marinobacterium arenosum]
MEDNVLEIILGSIAGNALVVGVLAFLFKSIVNHRLEKDMAIYHEKIRLDNEKILGEYRSELEKERIRLQISYGGIFEKQAEAIIEIYNSVLGVERTMSNAMHAGENKEEYYEAFIENWRVLSKSLDEKRIILPEHVVELLKKIQKDVFWGVHDYRRADYQLGKVTLSNEQIDKLFDKQDRALAITDKMPEIKQELVVSLRKLIGVSHGEGGN